MNSHLILFDPIMGYLDFIAKNFNFMARYNYYYSIDFIELTDFMTFSVINRRATAIIKVNT